MWEFCTSLLENNSLLQWTLWKTRILWKRQTVKSWNIQQHVWSLDACDLGCMSTLVAMQKQHFFHFLAQICAVSGFRNVCIRKNKKTGFSLETISVDILQLPERSSSPTGPHVYGAFGACSGSSEMEGHKQQVLPRYISVSMNGHGPVNCFSPRKFSLGSTDNEDVAW